MRSAWLITQGPRLTPQPSLLHPWDPRRALAPSQNQPASMAAVYRRISKVSCSQCELNHSASSPPWRRSSPEKNGTTEIHMPLCSQRVQCHPPRLPRRQPGLRRTCQPLAALARHRGVRHPGAGQGERVAEPGPGSRVPVPAPPCPVPRHRLLREDAQGGHGPWETQGHRCQKPALTPTAGRGGGGTVPGVPSTASPAHGDWYTVPSMSSLVRGPQDVAPGTLSPASWTQRCGPQHVIAGT